MLSNYVERDVYCFTLAVVFFVIKTFWRNFTSSSCKSS